MKRTLLFALFLLAAFPLSARIVDREEALRAAFPEAEIRYSPVFLTEEERKEASQISGVAVTTSLFARYDAFEKKTLIGRAYLDTHTVRTKKESVLVILDSKGKIRRVELVAFLEPPEYVPPDLWYRQFDGKVLNENLRIKSDIHGVTGATLTAQATTDAVRRVLAIDQLIRKKEEGQDQKKQQ